MTVKSLKHRAVGRPPRSDTVTSSHSAKDKPAHARPHGHGREAHHERAASPARRKRRHTTVAHARGRADASPSNSWVAFAFGAVFLVLAVGVVLFVPNLTDDQKTVMRVLIALSGGGVAAMIPGFISIKSHVTKRALSAGGAIAVFVVILLWWPTTSSTAADLPAAGAFACKTGERALPGCEVIESSAGRQIRFQIPEDDQSAMVSRFEGVVLRSGPGCWSSELQNRFTAGDRPPLLRDGGRLDVCRAGLRRWTGTWIVAELRKPFAMEAK